MSRRPRNAVRPRLASAAGRPGAVLIERRMMMSATVAGGVLSVTGTGPTGGYCNVAELQLFGTPAAPTPTRLAAIVFGTAGSYRDGGNTTAKAVDGDVSTYFDGPTADGNIVGLDLGSARQGTSIAFASRSRYEGRMTGGLFQASDTADFSAGVVVAYQVGGPPASGSLTRVGLSDTGAYRYWRHVSPAGSEGDIAEFELLGY